MILRGSVGPHETEMIVTSPQSDSNTAGSRFSSGSLLRFGLAAIPWVAVLVGTPFANKVDPFIFGMPFLLVWVVFCVIATSICMAIVYATDPRNRADDPAAEERRDRAEGAR